MLLHFEINSMTSKFQIKQQICPASFPIKLREDLCCQHALTGLDTINEDSWKSVSANHILSVNQAGFSFAGNWFQESLLMVSRPVNIFAGYPCSYLAIGRI